MDRLATILVDMIRSALAWEQEHGVPQQHSPKNKPSKPLTNIRVIYTLDEHENESRRDGNEHQDEKHQPGKDL